MEKEKVWLVISKDRNGKSHYRVYMDLDKAKAERPNDQKCLIQLIR